MELDRPINVQDIQRFSARTNPKATAKLLSVLGRKRERVDAIQSDIGKHLFGKIVVRMEELFEKVADDDITEEERAEFRVTRRLLKDWADEIDQYMKARDKLKS